LSGPRGGGGLGWRIPACIPVSWALRSGGSTRSSVRARMLGISVTIRVSPGSNSRESLGGTGVKCLDSRRRFARHELVTNNGTVSDVGVRVDSPAMCLCSCRKIGAFLRMRSV
jgi:hypothetical protein